MFLLVINGIDWQILWLDQSVRVKTWLEFRLEFSKVKSHRSFITKSDFQLTQYRDAPVKNDL